MRHRCATSDLCRTNEQASLTLARYSAAFAARSARHKDALQALCFLAGANSIFIGPKLLTTANPEASQDAALFADLGLRPMTMSAQAN